MCVGFLWECRFVVGCSVVGMVGVVLSGYSVVVPLNFLDTISRCFIFSLIFFAINFIFRLLVREWNFPCARTVS